MLTKLGNWLTTLASQQLAGPEITVNLHPIFDPKLGNISIY